MCSIWNRVAMCFSSKVIDKIVLLRNGGRRMHVYTVNSMIAFNCVKNWLLLAMDDDIVTSRQMG